jgi:uncharacterized protein YejL (UPF0352 family)
MNSRLSRSASSRNVHARSPHHFRKKTLRLVRKCCEAIEAGQPLDERLRSEAVVHYRYDVTPAWFKTAMKKGTITHDLISRINRDQAWVSAATMVLGCLLTDVINIRNAGDAGQRVIAILQLWLGDEWMQRVVEEGTWMPSPPRSTPRHATRAGQERRRSAP